MAFDLVSARIRLGITDASQDAIITVAMNAALALAEKYCDRKFMFTAGTVEFFNVSDNVLQLPRYPVKAVTRLTGTSTNYRVHQELGMILFDGHITSKLIKVTFSGGFDPLPADIELALWMIFDSTYGEVNGGGASIGGVNGVSRITVSGVGTIAYDTGASGAAAGAGGGALTGLIPLTALGILDMYRREYA